MTEAIVIQLQNGINNQDDMGEGRTVREYLLEALIKYRSNDEAAASEKLHKVFTYFAQQSYAVIIETEEFNEQQFALASVCHCDFVNQLVAEALSKMSDAHRACTGVSDDAVVVLDVLATILNIDHDFNRYISEESEMWPIEEDDDSK